MEVVEVSPPYDVADITSILGVTVIRETLGSLVAAGKLGNQPALPDPPYRLPDLS
ncbi:MAG: arginase family protein [Chloroflexota bacterium]